MKKLLTTAALCLLAHVIMAQNTTVPMGSSLNFPNSSYAPNADWTVTNYSGSLNFYWQNVYAPANRLISFRLGGDVSFPTRMSIGDVSCTTPSQCSVTTTAPLGINSLALAVGGKIGARGGIHVVSYGGAWPDYVFAPAYRLAPLREVEQYIQTNNHLPEMPSTAQVAAEGIELVAMDALLLKKAEELTLHLIRMEKENEALRTRVAKLEN